MYAAKQGWEVSAYDLSVEGKRKADELARKHQVEIDYHVGELHELGYEKEQFDVIAVIFTHFPSNIRAAMHKELTNYLRSGGIVVMEVFSKNQIKHQLKGNSGGGPKNIDMLYTLDDIQSDFDITAVYDVLYSENENFNPDNK